MHQRLHCAKIPRACGHLSSRSHQFTVENEYMETHGFTDKLLPDLSLDEIDFACDLERVLAEQVKYLRGALASANDKQLLERDSLVSELHSRLAEKDADISRLHAENDLLRKYLLDNLA